MSGVIDKQVGQIGGVQYHMYEGPLTAELAMLKRDGVAWICGAHRAEVTRRSVWLDICEKDRAELLVSLVPAFLRRCEVVVWQSDLWKTACRGSESFFGTASTEGPQSVRPQYWQWDGGHGWDSNPAVQEFFQLDGEHLVDGYLLMPGRGTSGSRGFTVGIVFNPCQGEMYPSLRFLPFLREGAAIGKFHFVAEIFAGLAFMRLELARKEPLRFARAEIRRAKRENRELPLISVIRLRRRQAAPQSELSSTIDWQHCWLVNSHWRQQWYPSENTHKPIFVEAYLKGPPDKPFLPPKRKIFRVDR